MADTAVSPISPALGAAYRSGAKGVDQLLVELVDRFKLDAMEIDPSIKGLWMYRDMTVADRDPRGAVQGIFFERDHPAISQTNSRAEEQPGDRLDRLMQEISELLDDAMRGTFTAVIGPSKEDRPLAMLMPTRDVRQALTLLRDHREAAHD